MFFIYLSNNFIDSSISYIVKSNLPEDCEGTTKGVEVIFVEVSKCWDFYKDEIKSWAEIFYFWIFKEVD